MKWAEYYDKFYDWSESTQVNKLSSVEALGPADEVAEVLMEFAFNRGEIANRLARKAVAQKVIFSADNLMDFTGSIDVELQNQLARLAVNSLSKEDLEKLDGFLDADILAIHLGCKVKMWSCGAARVATDSHFVACKDNVAFADMDS